MFELLPVREEGWNFEFFTWGDKSDIGGNIYYMGRQKVISMVIYIT